MLGRGGSAWGRGIRSPCRTSNCRCGVCSDDSIIVTARPARPHLRHLLEAHSVGIHLHQGRRGHSHPLPNQTAPLGRARPGGPRPPRHRASHRSGGGDAASKDRATYKTPPAAGSLSGVCRAGDAIDWRPHLNWMTVAGGSLSAGAGRGNRTPTPLRAPDFETARGSRWQSCSVSRGPAQSHRSPRPVS
jgi:hypothetical protein